MVQGLTLVDGGGVVGAGAQHAAAEQAPLQGVVTGSRISVPAHVPAPSPMLKKSAHLVVLQQISVVHPDAGHMILSDLGAKPASAVQPVKLSAHMRFAIGRQQVSREQAPTDAACMLVVDAQICWLVELAAFPV